MTGPEHYRKAEELLAQADGQFMDDSSDPLPRAEYASDEEWARALEESLEAHKVATQVAGLFAQMATGHAILAQTAATLASAYMPESADTEAWTAIVGTTETAGA